MGPKPKAATKPYVGPDWLKDASAFDWDKPPPKREAAIKADERIRNPGQPQQPAPALPEAAPGHHPIGLGPWGHEPSINVELPPKPKPHLPHQSMYDYERDPALVQRRAELVQKVRDELGPDILQAYFSSDACCNVDHVDMVLALPCMRGARVAVNCRPIGTHHSGILEDNGQSIRCDQCVAEVEAKAQRLAACAARSAEEDGGAWNKEEALRRASSSRLQFKKHCCGLSEGKSAHTEFLELVDVRLSLRELCKFVSRDVAASLYYCIYCRSDLHSRTKNRPHTIYTCACCPAAFHRSCYRHQTKERVGQDPGWHCASCAGGLPQGVAAGDGVAEPVGSFILAAPAQRSPVAAHRKARAGPCQQQQQEQQQEEVDEQQQQQQWEEEEEDEEKQQQHQEEEQEEEQPWAWDDDALDLFLNEPMNSSSSESELSHSSMSRGHQMYAGGEEEVVSPRGPVAPAAHAPAGMPAAAAPFAAPAPAAAGDASPGYPRAVAALKRVQAAFERERMSPGALQPSPHKMSPTTAAPSSPADGAQRRHPPAGLPPAPEPGGPPNAALRQLMMPPPGGGAVSGGSLAGAGTKVAPAPSRMPAGQPGPADQVAEVRQGLGLDSTAVDGRGSKKPAAVLQEGAQAGAMPAGVGSPGPPPQQLVDSILPAPSPLQPQQQDQEHEADSDSSGDEWRQGVKRRKAVPAPPANQPGDDAAAAVSAMENKEPQRRPQPWLKATAIRGRGDLREMLDAAALPLQQLQLPGVGAVGVTPGPAHSPAGKPQLSPANLTSTTPAQQQRRKQRPAGQEARAAAAEAVAAAAAAVAGAAHEPVPAQLQEAGGRAAGGTNQRPVQQGLRRAKLMGGNPAAAKVPLPVPPGAAQAPGKRGRLLQQQLGRERVMVGDVDRVQGGPQQNQALPGLQGLQHEPAGPLLKKQDKHPNPHRKPAAKRRRSATDGVEAAGAAAAVDSGAEQGRDVLPLAPQSNLTNPRAPDALPGASPVNMQRHPQVAAAAAAAAQKPMPAQCPPLPAAAAADMLRPRGNSTASFGQWLPISRGAGAAAADVANPTSVRQGGGGGDVAHGQLQGGWMGPPAPSAPWALLHQEEMDWQSSPAGASSHGPGHKPGVEPPAPAPVGPATTSQRKLGSHKELQQQRQLQGGTPAEAGGAKRRRLAPPPGDEAGQGDNGMPLLLQQEGQQQQAPRVKQEVVVAARYESEEPVPCTTAAKKDVVVAAKQTREGPVLQGHEEGRRQPGQSQQGPPQPQQQQVNKGQGADLHEGGPGAAPTSKQAMVGDPTSRQPAAGGGMPPGNSPGHAAEAPGLPAPVGSRGSPSGTQGGTSQLPAVAPPPPMPTQLLQRLQERQRRLQAQQRQQQHAVRQQQPPLEPGQAEQAEQGQAPNKPRVGISAAPTSKGAVAGNTLLPAAGATRNQAPTPDAFLSPRQLLLPSAKQPALGAGPAAAVNGDGEQRRGGVAAPAAAEAQGGTADRAPATDAAAAQALLEQLQQEQAPEPVTVVEELLEKQRLSWHEKMYVQSLLQAHGATFPPELVARACDRCSLLQRPGAATAAAAARGGRGRGGVGDGGRGPVGASGGSTPPGVISSSPGAAAAAGASSRRPGRTPGSASPVGGRGRGRGDGQQLRGRASGSPLSKSSGPLDAGMTPGSLLDDDAGWAARLQLDHTQQVGSDMDIDTGAPFPQQLPGEAPHQPGRRAKKAQQQGGMQAGVPTQQAASGLAPDHPMGTLPLQQLAAAAAAAAMPAAGCRGELGAPAPKRIARGDHIPGAAVDAPSPADAAGGARVASGPAAQLQPATAVRAGTGASDSEDDGPWEDLETVLAAATAQGLVPAAPQGGSGIGAGGFDSTSSASAPFGSKQMMAVGALASQGAAAAPAAAAAVEHVPVNQAGGVSPGAAAGGSPSGDSPGAAGGGTPGSGRQRQQVHGQGRGNGYRQQRRARASGSPLSKASHPLGVGIQPGSQQDDDSE